MLGIHRPITLTSQRYVCTVYYVLYVHNQVYLTSKTIGREIKLFTGKTSKYTYVPVPLPCFPPPFNRFPLSITIVYCIVVVQCQYNTIGALYVYNERVYIIEKQFAGVQHFIPNKFCLNHLSTSTAT